MIHGFPLVVGEQPKLLILGSMPSVVSLKQQEYYGFKHNRFWKIISRYFDVEFDSYETKLQTLKKHHIALWDVIGACEREGSLDSNIHSEEVNPIDQVLKTYPTLQMVICNGKKSYDLFQKHFHNLDVDATYLPSTSNANQTIREADLFEKWFAALNKVLKKD